MKGSVPWKVQFSLVEGLRREPRRHAQASTHTKARLAWDGGGPGPGTGSLSLSPLGHWQHRPRSLRGGFVADDKVLVLATGSTGREAYAAAMPVPAAEDHDFHRGAATGTTHATTGGRHWHTLRLAQCAWTAAARARGPGTGSLSLSPLGHWQYVRRGAAM